MDDERTFTVPETVEKEGPKPIAGEVKSKEVYLNLASSKSKGKSGKRSETTGELTGGLTTNTV